MFGAGMLKSEQVLNPVSVTGDYNCVTSDTLLSLSEPQLLHLQTTTSNTYQYYYNNLGIQ